MFSLRYNEQDYYHRAPCERAKGVSAVAAAAAAADQTPVRERLQTSFFLPSLTRWPTPSQAPPDEPPCVRVCVRVYRSCGSLLQPPFWYIRIMQLRAWNEMAPDA